MNTNMTIPTISRGDGNVIMFSWRDGQDHVRTMSYDMGDAIGSAVGFTTEMVQHAYLMGVDAIEPVTVDRSIERELREQRDALAESLDQAHAALADADRKVADAQAGIVTIGDAAMVHQAYERMVELHHLGYSEGMVDNLDELTGPSFDSSDPRAIMYNLGRQARRGDAETGQRIEALIGQVSTYQTDNTRLRNAVDELQRTITGMHEEFDHIALALLEEAEQRGWCDDYETFVDGVNDRTRTLKLIVRARDYELTFDIEVRPDTGPLDEEEGISDYSHDRDAQMTVTIPVTCRETDIEDHQRAWMRKLLAMSTVTSADFRNYDLA